MDPSVKEIKQLMTVLHAEMVEYLEKDGMVWRMKEHNRVQCAGLSK
jgi:uncharacterized lipoprotein YmbA